VVKLREFVQAAERLVPSSLAESWDNVGLLVGDPDQRVHRALLAVDLTASVVAEARANQCDLWLTYHPPIFQGLKRVTAGSLIYEALRQGVAIYAFHTALDVVSGGTNDLLADALGLLDRAPLRLLPNAPPGDARGMGRVGHVHPIARTALMDQVKNALGLSGMLVSGPLDGVVRRAACCAGSCGDLLDEALRRNIDVYLTGELRHHDALKAASAAVTVMCTLHSNSERPVMAHLAAQLKEALPALECVVSTQDADPFHWHQTKGAAGLVAP
jgi:dinuclear metal center YbgI/SA1388 family protein